MRSPVRIAITGLGMVTPFGLTAKQSWAGICSGQSAVRWLPPEFGTHPAFQKHPLFGAAVPWNTDESSRLVPFARQAAREAIAQSGLSSGDLQSAGCVFGTSKIEMSVFDTFVADFRSPDAFHQKNRAPEFWESTSPAGPAEALARDWKCGAAVIAPVAACATGLVSLLRASELIQAGDCKIALAGSADASLHPGLLSSYRRLGVQAHPGENPAEACRPFDRNRTGFAVGEGAACLVMEEWEHACSRGAPILAEWIGGRLGSDPSGITQVNSDGRTLTEMIQRLLRDHQLSPEDISCVSLHGTATRLNDAAEAAAMQQIFGQLRPFAFGLKGAIGHLMGAAGSVETAVSILSLLHQKVPPTCNHETPDAPLAVRLLPSSMKAELKTILKVSLGFGGHVATALVKQASMEDQVIR